MCAFLEIFEELYYFIVFINFYKNPLIKLSFNNLMKVSKKKIKERSTTELQKENNDILDQNSSIDDLSVDKKQYLTEASNINVLYD